MTSSHNLVQVGIAKNQVCDRQTYGTPPMYSGSSKFNSTSGELELIVVTLPLFS